MTNSRHVRALRRQRQAIGVGNGLIKNLTKADLAIPDDEAGKDLDARRASGADDHGLEALPSRRAFEEEAARHIAFARRHKHPLCFALVAFDHGSDANDADGETVDDEFLHDATARWRHVLRGEDLMGRWAEDEFAILLPNCTTVSAVQLCWRLREKTPEGHSFSAGLVTYQGTETVQGLVGRAADCLTQAKAKGRDRTVAEGLVDLD
jgi:diguanylate cyclase